MPKSPIPNSDALEAAEDAAIYAVFVLCKLAADGGNCHPVIAGRDVSTQTISWCLEVGVRQNERGAALQQLQAEGACMMALLQLGRPDRLDVVDLGVCFARAYGRTVRSIVSAPLMPVEVSFGMDSPDPVVHKLSTATNGGEMIISFAEYESRAAAELRRRKGIPLTHHFSIEINGLAAPTPRAL